MKLNSTVALTLTLLVLMIGAGLVSATWGSALGREALKGITQPDTRPNSNTTGRQSDGARREELAVLPEAKIIANVKARMSGSTSKEAKASTDPVATAKATTTPTPSQAGFPLTVTSRDVALTVESARQKGDAMVLTVNLHNNGKKPVRFLYDLLTVTDDQGRTVKAAAEGLPAELPASSDVFPGTINISAKSLDGVQKVSLSLTDYPDKQLQLQLSDIPLTR